jgi:phage shock protein PspC (stress-responsive transcriptional regulator)
MKHLYRCKENRIIAGVASGIAEYFEVDPNLIRLLFVLLFFIPPAVGFWLYLAGIIFIPEEGTKNKDKDIAKEVERTAHNAKNFILETSSAFKKTMKESINRRRVLGGILLVLGLVFLLDRFYSAASPSLFWGLIFLFVGIVLLAQTSK